MNAKEYKITHLDSPQLGKAEIILLLKRNLNITLSESRDLFDKINRNVGYPYDFYVDENMLSCLTTIFSIVGFIKVTVDEPLVIDEPIHITDYLNERIAFYENVDENVLNELKRIQEKINAGEISLWFTARA